MIKFKQTQSAIEFANNPIVIIRTENNDVLLSVRVRASADHIIKVKLTEQTQDAVLTTQSVSDAIQLNVKEQIIFDESTARSVQSVSNIDTRQIVSATDSQNTIIDMMTGGDGLRSIAAQAISAIGDAMREVSSVVNASDAYTHEAVLRISQDDIQNNVSVTAYALRDDVLIGSVTMQASLLKQFSLVSNKIDNPKCEFRMSADVPVLSVNARDNLTFIYKREIGRTALQNFDLIAKNYGDAEIRFDKSLSNICEIVVVASDAAENAYSSGTRLVIKPQNKTHFADAKFIVLRAEEGFDLCVKDIFNVNFVKFSRIINGIKTIIAIEKIEHGQRSITINDSLVFQDVCEYGVELQSGGNSVSLPCQTVSAFGSQIAYAQPKLTNLSTSITNDGLLTSFVIEPTARSGDASVARSIINSDASSNLFNSEIATQRAEYDQAMLFSVLRIDRDTGDETDLGVVSSGSFKDAMPLSTISRNFRYAVYTTRRDPESLLQFVKFVSGSQPYSYYPATYRHPYALHDGVIVKQESRSLRHPFIDAAIGLSSKPVIADVTFQPAEGGDISISAERVSVKSVLLTITDQLHETRVGYVVIALASDGKFELVGYVNSFRSRVNIYHNVSIVPDTLTYALAALSPNMSVDVFVVGPSLVLS